ncbi:hypothetical protein E1B28_009849 [Marasmius oreades]|uniref:Uncharacterized protein n=1 Tax=Marasmius oreades TaxID=181124 RepID=A0A9P7RVY7_9AGAR|nr:uncharacterized protein E1B28_009849 [Marasmius oreades]KAG7090764.1 hypothetical protein E1B28_009849 [Marasmius oreades]
MLENSVTTTVNNSSALAMWCTRWFLPLFLLPLPTAPPLFLVLLLFSLTIHAKPCFYCIVLLATLFVSSCYWQPFPVDTPLSNPWAHNITTFGEALNASLTASSYWESDQAKSLPSSIHPVDRCWCDFSSGSLFEPFNTSNWEIVSIMRAKGKIERQLKHDEAIQALDEPKDTKTDEHATTETEMPKTASPSTPSPGFSSALPRSGFASLRPTLWKLVQSLRRPGFDDVEGRLSNLDSSDPESTESELTKSLPLVRDEYDLRPFGIGVFIDFKWSR